MICVGTKKVSRPRINVNFAFKKTELRFSVWFMYIVVMMHYHKVMNAWGDVASLIC